MILTKNPVKKILKSTGAKRVSKDAVEELTKILEKEAINLCKRAKKLAKLAGRKTVMKQDIKLAIKEIKESR